MSTYEERVGGEASDQEHYISYEEFLKVHSKIGKVIQAESVQGMKKVLKIRVDVGVEQRDLAVGATQYYKPEELVGKVVVVCTNLQPKKIGSIISNGMLQQMNLQEGQYFLLLQKEKILMLEPSSSRIN